MMRARSFRLSMVSSSSTPQRPSRHGVQLLLGEDEIGVARPAEGGGPVGQGPG